MRFGRRLPEGFQGFNRRRAMRIRRDSIGHLVMQDTRIIGCYVRDLSNTGALIEVRSTFGVPERLVLLIPEGRRWARMVWKSTYRFGVQFES